MHDSDEIDRASARPWLLDLATEQRGSSQVLSDVVYDEATQMSYVLQEPHVPVIDTGHATVTKKADVEVGEDQKR